MRGSWRRKRCQHWCWHRRLSAHTHLDTSKDLRHRNGSISGWRNWSTVHRKLSPTHDDQCTTPSSRAQRRFLFDNFDVHGYTFSAARIRISVIARFPPLTGATDLRHVLVSAPLLPLELTDALRAERERSICVCQDISCYHHWSRVLVRKCWLRADDKTMTVSSRVSVGLGTVLDEFQEENRTACARLRFVSAMPK